MHFDFKNLGILICQKKKEKELHTQCLDTFHLTMPLVSYNTVYFISRIYGR